MRGATVGGERCRVLMLRVARPKESRVSLRSLSWRSNSSKVRGTKPETRILERRRLKDMLEGEDVAWRQAWHKAWQWRK